MAFFSTKIVTRLGIAALLTGVPLPAQANETTLEESRGGGVDNLGTCVPDATRLCFYDGRFSAVMTYESGSGPVSANAVQPAGGKPGFFSFDNAFAAELWLDVLDGCAINNQMWVTFLGVSARGWSLRVDDHLFNQWKSYTVPTGSYGPPVTQIDSFPCAGFTAAKKGEAGPLAATSLYLGENGRFEVTATLPAVAGEASQLTRDSGLFGFFGAGSPPNLLIKMVYPGLDPGWYGLVVSVSQDDVTVTVTDRCTGAVKSYTREATTYGDADAFLADDSACTLFGDGFESGDTSGWSITE